MTTAHAHKSGVIFHFFQELSNKTKKIKALRPKMTKIASRGGGGGGPALILRYFVICALRNAVTASHHIVGVEFFVETTCLLSRSTLTVSRSVR